MEVGSTRSATSLGLRPIQGEATPPLSPSVLVGQSAREEGGPRVLVADDVDPVDQDDDIDEDLDQYLNTSYDQKWVNMIQATTMMIQILKCLIYQRRNVLLLSARSLY